VKPLKPSRMPTATLPVSLTPYATDRKYPAGTPSEVACPFRHIVAVLDAPERPTAIDPSWFTAKAVEVALPVPGSVGSTVSPDCCVQTNASPELAPRLSPTIVLPSRLIAKASLW